MVKHPTVSVVVTTHNSASYVAEGLASVLQQTFRDFEIVVVDDASVDATCDEVNRALQGWCRYRLIRMERNSGGPATPRNIGIREAVGDWVALLDADDVWHPQKMEVELGVAKLCKCRFVSSEKRWFSSVGETSPWAAERFSVSAHRMRRVTHGDLIRKNFLCTSSVLVDRSLLVQNAFNADPAYRAIEDYRCWLDIHRNTGASSVQILTPLVFYRVSDTSISSSKLAMARKVWRLYRDYFRGEAFGGMKAVFFMGTYAGGSLYRQLKYRRSRCKSPDA